MNIQEILRVELLHIVIMVVIHVVILVVVLVMNIPAMQLDIHIQLIHIVEKWDTLVLLAEHVIEEYLVIILVGILK